MALSGNASAATKRDQHGSYSFPSNRSPERAVKSWAIVAPRSHQEYYPYCFAKQAANAHMLQPENRRGLTHKGYMPVVSLKNLAQNSQPTSVHPPLAILSSKGSWEFDLLPGPVAA